MRFAEFEKGPDLQEFWACTMTVEGASGDHLCGRRAVAVYEGAEGRLPRCKVHEGRPQRAGYVQVQL